MSVHYVKLLELVAIESNNEKLYLHIKLFTEQEFELFWEIDSDTANSLINISEFDGYHKYRLSLHTTWDTSKNQFISSLTKTYRDISERIYFACSIDYKNCLESIKNSESMNDLNKLPFVSMNLSVIDEKKFEIKSEQNEVVNAKGYHATIKSVIAMISVIFLIFVYFNYPLNNATSNHSNASHSEVIITEILLKSTKNNVASATELVSDDATEFSLPFIKIDDSVAYSIPKGYVALTFDDGPSKYTKAITDILKKYQVGGTFFFVGINAKKYPDYVQYVLSNGHSIGSHSMNHFIMSKLSIEEMEDELLQSTKVIEDITKEEVVLFRPPYGEVNDQIKGVVHNHHKKIILWNKDSEDWKNHDPDKIFNYVHESEASGSIILFHESQAVVDALPRIIENLQERNLKIVNLQ